MPKSRFMMSLAVAAAAAAAFVAGSAQSTPPATMTAELAADTHAAPAAAAPQAFATKAEADAATRVNTRASERQARTVAAPGQCTGTWVWLTATVGVFNHASPNPSDIKYWLPGGQYVPCRKLVLGDRYSGCGYTNANGYILIPDIRNGVSYAPAAGLIISTCTED